jgi:hypothetical protein
VLVNCWCLAGMGDPLGLIYPPRYGSGKLPHPWLYMRIPMVSYCYLGDESGESILDGDLLIAIWTPVPVPCKRWTHLCQSICQKFKKKLLWTNSQNRPPPTFQSVTVCTFARTCTHFESIS